MADITGKTQICKNGYAIYNEEFATLFWLPSGSVKINDPSTTPFPERLESI